AVPLYILLHTYMRVGNEIYYRLHHHKGLTTLKKSDIKISGAEVSFKYISKGGVPLEITESFPNVFVERLKRILKPLKKGDFVFVEKKTRSPLKDTAFKFAFKKYCGFAFYPHIVRSWFATRAVEDFLKSNPHPSKRQVRELYTQIAEKLGHKKFVKKKRKWEDSYAVTVHHYIRPELVKKVKLLSEGVRKKV
ncbi:MAG: hypothetical protein NUV67_00105, partial [archaeon]|nr:hypothetical protein [archaeon]